VLNVDIGSRVVELNFTLFASRSVSLSALNIFTYIVLVLLGVGVGFCIRK
jgi:hypothetical protein